MVKIPGGTIKVEWLNDGRNMRLLEDYIYTDPHDVEWIAPEGAVIDGASIPKLLWTVSGSPFGGQYRVASVFHDVYCKTRTRPYQQTHDMFWDCMMATGVDEDTADRFWWAVSTFGPRWDDDGNDIEVEPEPPDFDEEW